MLIRVGSSGDLADGASCLAVFAAQGKKIGEFRRLDGWIKPGETHPPPSGS